MNKKLNWFKEILILIVLLYFMLSLGGFGIYIYINKEKYFFENPILSLSESYFNSFSNIKISMTLIPLFVIILLIIIISPIIPAIIFLGLIIYKIGEIIDKRKEESEETYKCENCGAKNIEQKTLDGIIYCRCCFLFFLEKKFNKNIEDMLKKEYKKGIQ